MAAKQIDWTVPGILGGFAAVLWLMAAASGAFHAHLAGRVERIEGWPTTDAVVKDNHWETYPYLDPETNRYEPRPILKLEYTYEVDGRSYTSTRVHVDGTGGRFIDTDYPVGARMPVRYDPDDPAIAGVKVDLHDEMKLGWFAYLTLGLATAGVAFAALAARSLLRQRAASS